MQTRVKIAASRPFSGASKDSCGSVEDRTYSTVLSNVEGGGEGSETEGSLRVARSPTKHLTPNNKYATKEERRGKSHNNNYKNNNNNNHNNKKKKGKKEAWENGETPNGKKKPAPRSTIGLFSPAKVQKKSDQHQAHWILWGEPGDVVE